MCEPDTDDGRTTERDYYAVLQVDPNASRTTIEAAYERLAKKYHPDLTREPDDPERMREVDEAFDVLDDAGRRAEYDRLRAAPSESTPGGSSEAAQEDILPKATVGRTRPRLRWVLLALVGAAAATAVGT